MTRTQSGAHWSGVPSLSHPWMAALLRLIAMFVVGAVRPLRMLLTLLPRECHTDVERDRLPAMEDGTRTKETIRLQQQPDPRSPHGEQRAKLAPVEPRGRAHRRCSACACPIPQRARRSSPWKGEAQQAAVAEQASSGGGLSPRGMPIKTATRSCRFNAEACSASPVQGEERQRPLQQRSSRSEAQLPEPRAYARTAPRPRYRAAEPSSSSIRSSWLYFASRSDRASDPVLICPQLVATARSAIVESSVSPDR